MAEATEKTKETKSEHFKRLATHRVNSAIEWCEKLGKLNAPNLYDYEDGDVDKIEAALNEATAKAVAALRNRTGKRQGFSLDA